MSIGIIASAVVAGVVPGPNDLLLDAFNNLDAWAAGGTTIVTGRTGTAAELTGTSAATTYTSAPADESDIYIIGFAFRWSDGVTGLRQVLEVRSDATGTLHNRLRLDPATGQLTVTRGNATIVGTAATGLLVPSTWYYIETRVKLGDAPNGQAQVRLNGTDIINVTGIDTKNAGTKTVYDSVRLTGGVIGIVQQYDDFYLSKGAAATFKGDIQL